MPAVWALVVVGSYMRAIIAKSTEDHLVPLLGFVVSAYGAVVDRRTVDDIATFAQPPHSGDGQKKLDSPVSALPPEDAARFTPTRRHDDTYLKWGEVIYALSNGLRLETTAGGGLKSSNGNSEAKAETSR
ncbi:hypothetical protein V498_02959 [Pseudogymnoascus sp. VKM F-4517 (FW-2822)]|nr:hypothetical protein V498_02959 [Pseudogymnoascus sp. VKM F-4517 (FW-2822)]